MSLIVSIDGVPITQNVAPSGINITHRADGESSFGGIPIEDPTAALTVVGHRLITVEEDECSQPRLFTGFVTQRDMGRAAEEGLLAGPDPRLIDTSVVDMNACLAFRQITGADGNRGVETWAARLDWIIASDYLSEFIPDNQDWIVVNTTSMEPCDYRGSYANAVLDDLVDRSGGAYVYHVFWDPGGSGGGGVRLFFDNDVEVIGACDLSISNVESDVDGIDVFAPTTTSKLAREPDQTYSDVTVVYDRGAKKLYRYRPSTAATYVRRGTEIARPYTRGLATATAQAEAFLDKHSVETDRITCSIQVPAASVGLVQAGQSIDVRFSHLPGYESAAFTTMRIVSCSPKPTNDVGDFYDVALELVYQIAPGTPLTCAAALASTEDETNIEVMSAYQQEASVTITPTNGPALLLAWIIGAGGFNAAPNDTPMSAIADYTTLATGSCSRNTYTIASRQVASPSGGYTATATADWDYVNGVWDGVPIAMQIAIHTEASTPVQDFFACGEDGGYFGSDPTPGNMIVMMYYAESVAVTIAPSEPPTGWTTLYEATNATTDYGFGAPPYRSPEKAIHLGIYARCVTEGDDFTTATKFACDKSGGYPSGMGIYVSEWEITGTISGGGGGGDTVIDLGPTPGATTTHTTDPTVDDDESLGYGTPGMGWINSSTGDTFELVDGTDGAAVWTQTSPVPLALDDLTDVTAPSPADGDGIVWRSGPAAWVNEHALTEGDVVALITPDIYACASLTVIASHGTIAAGAHTDLHAVGGTTVQIDETSGAPGYDVEAAFTGVDGLTDVYVHGYYTGSHTDMLAQLYNYDTTSWDTVITFAAGQSTMQLYHAAVSPATPYFDGGGNAKVRFYHTSSGNPTHRLYLDYLAISHSAGTTGGLALDDLTDVDAAAPADGDVLTWDDGNSEWIAAAPTPAADITDIPTAETDTALVLHPDGAGGVEWAADATGGSTVWTPDTPPGSPNADDDEFDTLSGWTTLGTLDTSNVSDFDGYWHVKRASSSEINGIYKAVPSTPFTITAKIQTADLSVAAHPSVGIMLLDATPTAIRAFELTQAGGGYYYSLRRYTNRTSFSSSIDTAAGYVLLGGRGLHSFYLRLLVTSSSSVTFSYSWDGFLWYPVTNIVAIDPTITPAYWGLEISDPVSACTVEAVFDWVRIT